MEAAASMPRVLVIDDEKGPRESLRILLKLECEVLCAASVEEGLRLFSASPPRPGDHGYPHAGPQRH